MELYVSSEQEQVRSQLVNFSVSAQTMRAFVRCCVLGNDEQRGADNAYLESLIETGEMVLANSSEISPRHLRNFILELNEALNIAIATEQLDPGWISMARKVRAGGSLGLFVCVSYLVLGGIWSGDSNLASELGRWTIYMVLAFFILVLGILEGTQLSVTILKLKDLEPVKSRFPRAYRLHKIFKTDAGTKKYLAGRQLMVIMIVFCIAQLTSFPTIKDWPLTSEPLPEFFQPWIHLVFFKLGILGAIFVLWFGQLIPQFLATSNPQKFLNWPGLGLVLKAAWWSESLGITQPVDWLTRNADSGETIPPSNKEVFFETSQNFGYAILSLVKTIIIKANRTTATTESHIQVLAPNHDLLIDNSITFVKGDLIEGSDKTSCTLIRQGKALESNNLRVSIDDKCDAQSGGHTRTIEVKLREGNFQPDDILRIVNTMELQSCERADITVESPTRYTHFHVEIHGKPSEVRVPSMIFHHWDAIRNGFSESGEEQVELSTRENKDFLLYEQTTLFPKQFAKHCYNWAFDYHENDGR